MHVRRIIQNFSVRNMKWAENRFHILISNISSKDCRIALNHSLISFSVPYIINKPTVLLMSYKVVFLIWFNVFQYKFAFDKKLKLNFSYILLPKLNFKVNQLTNSKTHAEIYAIQIKHRLLAITFSESILCEKSL